MESKKNNSRTVICKGSNFNGIFAIKDETDPERLPIPRNKTYNEKIVHSVKNGIDDTQSIIEKSKRMKKVLINIENNAEELPKEELNNKINETLREFLIEMIESNPNLGFILGRIKANYDKLDERIQLLKVENQSLNGSIERLNDKISMSEITIQHLKIANENYKRETNELHGKLLDSNKKLSQFIEARFNNKISEEVEEIFTENQYLKQVICCLRVELKKIKRKQDFLIEKVKNTKEFGEDFLRKVEEILPDYIMIGKNKIRIPILDLSMVERSISSDDNDNSEDGIAYMSEDNYETHLLCSGYSHKIKNDT